MMQPSGRMLVDGPRRSCRDTKSLVSVGVQVIVNGVPAGTISFRAAR